MQELGALRVAAQRQGDLEASVMADLDFRLQQAGAAIDALLGTPEDDEKAIWWPRTWSCARRPGSRSPPSTA